MDMQVVSENPFLGGVNFERFNYLFFYNLRLTVKYLLKSEKFLVTCRLQVVYSDPSQC